MDYDEYDRESPYEQDFCGGCGEYPEDCMCWLDEECQRCGELNYRCECDD